MCRERVRAEDAASSSPQTADVAAAGAAAEAGVAGAAGPARALRAPTGALVGAPDNLRIIKACTS